ncbi:hypothetical protein VP01_90g4 [Puccinia sorghi]|uniref:Uncharacterized protein n=1 Tax=Puccinia sorghi TaxID=27349 RepID=A0A0L6U7L2_9BASI|nr:hypothetical protein VP01_90g4 [Puccinia sorghi]
MMDKQPSGIEYNIESNHYLLSLIVSNSSSGRSAQAPLSQCSSELVWKCWIWCGGTPFILNRGQIFYSLLESSCAGTFQSHIQHNTCGPETFFKPGNLYLILYHVSYLKHLFAARTFHANLPHPILRPLQTIIPTLKNAYPNNWTKPMFRPRLRHKVSWSWYILCSIPEACNSYFLTLHGIYLVNTLTTLSKIDFHLPQVIKGTANLPIFNTAKRNLLNCLQLTCNMLQPSCHPNSTLCTVTVHQRLVESLLEKGWSNNISFLGVSACQLQSRRSHCGRGASSAKLSHTPTKLFCAREIFFASIHGSAVSHLSVSRTGLTLEQPFGEECEILHSEGLLKHKRNYSLFFVFSVFYLFYLCFQNSSFVSESMCALDKIIKQNIYDKLTHKQSRQGRYDLRRWYMSEKSIFISFSLKTEDARRVVRESPPDTIELLFSLFPAHYRIYFVFSFIVTFKVLLKFYNQKLLYYSYILARDPVYKNA